MNVLITGGHSRLARAIVGVLALDHTLHLWGTPQDVGLEATWVQGDVRDPNVAGQAVQGMDAIIHTGEPPLHLPDDPLAQEQELLDLATRGTHVLFKAGVEAGVKRFVYGSTLEVFESYPDDVFISEMWRPKPTPEPFALTRYLGELTAREFAREFAVSVTALRLGKLVVETDVTDTEPDLMWLDFRDAAHAFALALGRDASAAVNFRERWALHHICAAIPNGKYLVASGGWNVLAGFEPQHNFESHWQGGAK